VWREGGKEQHQEEEQEIRRSGRSICWRGGRGGEEQEIRRSRRSRRSRGRRRRTRSGGLIVI